MSVKAQTLHLAVHSAILAKCPTSILVVDHDLQIVFANESAESMFATHNLGESEMSLLSIIPGLKDIDRATFGTPDGTWLLHQASREGLQVDAQRGHDKFPAELDITSLKMGGHSLTIVVVHDMTDLNASMSTIFKAHQELEEFNRVAIGRELRMVALKQELNDLLEEHGLPPRYLEDD